MLDTVMLVIVQARYSSQRLPGKVLRPLAGRPMLAWLLESLSKCQLVSEVILATSNQASDDPVAEFAAIAGVRCFRGSLNDVTGRMLAAAEHRGASSFVRVSGDSPLMDYRLVDQLIDLYGADSFDLASNVFIRTFPKGFSVEVVSVDALRKASSMAKEGEEEHVTPVFYRRPQDFRILSVTSGHDWGHIQMSVDTAEDFDIAEQTLLTMSKPLWHYEMSELIALRRLMTVETVSC